jgi:hypothetical protein
MTARPVALRTALIWCGEVMNDVVSEVPAKITLGHKGTPTFIVPDVGLPSGFAIVSPGNRGYLLTLGDKMRGTVCIDGREQDVREFVKHGDETLADLLIRRTDPDLVAFQMDVLWVYFPGQDPASWLLKYPGRWASMHLKDLRKGVERGPLTGKTDVRNDVALGTGQVDWTAVLAAAKKAGVK